MANKAADPKQQNAQMAMPMGMDAMPPGMFESEMIGAIKIKDGLFIGDELASTDLEFVVANKVTHIINCAGKQIENHWERIGVAYLTFFWLDQDNQLLLDQKDEASNAIFDFIEEALNATESVLVHSVRGQSRATCALAAYIMRKYNWSLLKSLEFLNSRRPDLEIRATFIHQLSAYEMRLQEQMNKVISSKWDELSNTNPNFACEELLLRNTFINSQMGPFPIPTPEQTLQEKGENRKAAIKWTDEGKDDKAKLQTNFSKDDLVVKVEDTSKPLNKVDNHRKTDNKPKKSTIKPFKIDNNKLTGLENFTEICKDPLALPDYYFPNASQATASANSTASKAKGQAPDAHQTQPVSQASSKQKDDTQASSGQQQNQGSKKERIDQKAKRPDDKIDRESKSLRRQNDRNLERRQQSSVHDNDNAKGESENTKARGSKQSSSTNAPSNDLFYKKESDRQILSGNEDDMDDVTEVKPSKKGLKISESDFENDAQPIEKRSQNQRSGSKRPQFGSQTSNQEKQSQGAGASKRQKGRMAEDSMTEASDDDRAFNSHNQQNRLSQRQNAGNDRHHQQQRGQRKTTVGNVTNIINNNNINNYIINDPSKAPPQFHMSHAQQTMGAEARVQTAPADVGQNLDRSQDFGGRIGQKQYSTQNSGPYMPSRQSNSGGGLSQQNRPKKVAQQFRSNSLTNRKEIEGVTAVVGSSQSANNQPRGVYNMWADRKQRSQNSQGSQQPQYVQPGQNRVNAKKKGNNFNQTVVSIVKKELQKRHESPRSRRQLINNLAGPQSYNRRPNQNGTNQFLAGPAVNNNMMGQQFNGLEISSGVGASFGAQNDLTFFDSKMFAQGGHSTRSVGNRAGGGISGSKFASGAQSEGGGSQFFNRTGPIKIPHKKQYQGHPTNSQSQQQSQHVEDLFNVTDDMGAEIAVNGSNRNANSQGFANTQKVQSNAGKQNQLRGGSSGQQPGSRRELQNSHGQVSGVNTGSTRPGTAPQNLNGLLSSNSQSKPNRPTSPFTKVYQNQLGSGQTRFGAGSKPRTSQIRTGAGVNSSGIQGNQKHRTAGNSTGPSHHGNGMRVGGHAPRGTIRSHSPGQNNFVSSQSNAARMKGMQVQNGGNGTGVFGNNNLMFGSFAPAQQMMMAGAGSTGPQFYQNPQARGNSPYDRIK